MAANAAVNDQQKYYAPHLQTNALTLANVKFFSACFAGAAAGVACWRREASACLRSNTLTRVVNIAFPVWNWRNS